MPCFGPNRGSKSDGNPAWVISFIPRQGACSGRNWAVHHLYVSEVQNVAWCRDELFADETEISDVPVLATQGHLISKWVKSPCNFLEATLYGDGVSWKHCLPDRKDSGPTFGIRSSSTFSHEDFSEYEKLLLTYCHDIYRKLKGGTKMDGNRLKAMRRLKCFLFLRIQEEKQHASSNSCGWARKRIIKCTIESSWFL